MPIRSARLLLLLAFILGFSFAHAAPVSITALSRNGVLAWTNALRPGVLTIETAALLEGPWSPVRNVYSTNSSGRVTLTLDGEARFHRVRSADVSGTPEGFTNLVNSYGLLETIAGNGAGQLDGVSFWQESNEGGPATLAGLSRPHYAMA